MLPEPPGTLGQSGASHHLPHILLCSEHIGKQRGSLDDTGRKYLLFPILFKEDDVTIFSGRSVPDAGPG